MSIAVARSRAVTTTYAAFRNLLHNGAMKVAQRGSSVASITTSAYRTVDRWSFDVNALGTWTMSKTADRPAGTQFTHCTKLLCTTADASPAAGDYLIFQQGIEGQNVQTLQKGTANAQTLTLSFWVKSNKTGTYIAELEDLDNNRTVHLTYTISVADTWERKVLTFPADTTGALDNDANGSLFVEFWLGAGSNFTSGTLNTTWAATTNANRAVGQTNLAAATNNYWQITGVQLEVGSTATPFEDIPFDVEQTRCQRYYIRLNSGSEGSGGAYCNFGHGRGQNSKAAYIQLHLPTRMRVAPTSVNASGTLTCGNGGSTFTVSSVAFDMSNVLSPSLSVSGTVATVGTGSIGFAESCALYSNNDANAYLELTADL